MSNDWKEKLYEPEGELVKIDSVSCDDSSEKLIEINSVDLSYSGRTGDIKALENIHLNIFSGEFVCVLGPSGCGKSTLLGILAGFIKPTAGAVRLNGEEIKGTDRDRGVVFQNPPLYEWYSVRKNVAFGPRMRGLPKSEYEPLVDEYLSKVGLSEFADKKIY